MDRDFYIQLTQELYKITLLFPKKEPLRYKIRDLGIDILVELTLLLKTNPLISQNVKQNLLSQAQENLEILDSFFEVARAQNWVGPKTILEIKSQYSKIGRDLRALDFRKSAVPKEKIGLDSFNLRQGQVLRILKKQARVQVSDLKKHFPQLSKRTLRRDLQDLVERGLVEKTGEKKNTFYQLT